MVDGKKNGDGPKSWDSFTWEGAEREPVPEKTISHKLRGVLRLLAFTLMTIGLLPIFFIARALSKTADRRVVGWWCRAGARLNGLRFRIKGECMQFGGALLVNHMSWIDILAVGAVAPVHFVSKAEVAAWPLLGWIGKISNTVFIERRRTAAKAQQSVLSDRMNSGQLLCLFPEGTSTDGRRVLPFRSSLFRVFLTDKDNERITIALQPVSLYYVPDDGLPPTFFCWWGDCGLKEHIWDVSCLGSGEVRIYFHDPIDPECFSDRKVLAHTATEVVAAGRALAAQQMPFGAP
jgi:1-acyl-sn-glycerol-3-phosphate acyltransferase